jgi:glycosyltransferase involved in cell wall biosynthesis
MTLSATILIATYNRSGLLQRTLESLRALNSSRSWDVIVVDNNSSDDTRRVIEAQAATFPVPLFYLFEPKQGKSVALNAGLRRTRADVVVFTDDDVLVDPHWLDAACAPMEDNPRLAYSGGPVRPLWQAEPPDWLDQHRGDLWGTLAILDYGPAPFVFEARQRVPVGANMAVRRSLIEQIGGFHPDLGRRGGSLLGQEQAEFFARARACGARGGYSPQMEVHHHVPAERLTRQYFRRWWYWKGVTRSLVDAMHGETELGLELKSVPYVGGVPRFVWGLIARSAVQALTAGLVRNQRARMRHVMTCAYGVGYVRGCWSRRWAPARPFPLATQQEEASVSR